MPVLRATCASITTYTVIATYRGNSLENSGSTYPDFGHLSIT